MKEITYKCNLCGEDNQSELFGLCFVSNGKGQVQLVSIMNELTSYEKHICQTCIRLVRSSDPYRKHATEE